MTFNQYLVKEIGQDWQGIQMDLIDEGWNEEKLNEHLSELEEQFEEYAEVNEIEIISV